VNLVGSSIITMRHDANRIGLQVEDPIDPITGSCDGTAFFKWVQTSFIHKQVAEVQAASSQNIYVAFTVGKKFFLEIESFPRLLIVPSVENVAGFWHHRSRRLETCVGLFSNIFLIFLLVEQVRKIALLSSGSSKAFGMAARALAARAWPRFWHGRESHLQAHNFQSSCNNLWRQIMFCKSWAPCQKVEHPFSKKRVNFFEMRAIQ